MAQPAREIRHERVRGTHRAADQPRRHQLRVGVDRRPRPHIAVAELALSSVGQFFAFASDEGQISSHWIRLHGRLRSVRPDSAHGRAEFAQQLHDRDARETPVTRAVARRLFPSRGRDDATRSAVVSLFTVDTLHYDTCTSKYKFHFDFLRVWRLNVRRRALPNYWEGS